MNGLKLERRRDVAGVGPGIRAGQQIGSRLGGMRRDKALEPLGIILRRILLGRGAGVWYGA